MVMRILVLRTYSSGLSTGIPQGFPQKGKHIAVKSPVHGPSAGVKFLGYPVESEAMRKLMEELIAELVRNEIPLDLAKRELERIYLEQVLAANNGNQSAAARKLGIHRNTLSKKLEPLLDAMRYPGINC